MVDSFINNVILYDDKLIITFNYKDGTATILLKDIENHENTGSALYNIENLCSDLARPAQPKLDTFLRN